MTEQEWKERERSAAVRALVQQEEQKQRQMAAWCVVWFAQRQGKPHA